VIDRVRRQHTDVGWSISSIVLYYLFLDIGTMVFRLWHFFDGKLRGLKDYRRKHARTIADNGVRALYERGSRTHCGGELNVTAGGEITAMKTF